MPRGPDKIGIAFTVHPSLCLTWGSDCFGSHLLGCLVGIAPADVLKALRSLQHHSGSTAACLNESSRCHAGLESHECSGWTSLLVQLKTEEPPMHSCRVWPCCRGALLAACTRLIQVASIQPAPLQIVRMLWLSPAAAGHLKSPANARQSLNAALVRCTCCREIISTDLVVLQTLSMLPAACAHAAAEPCRDSPPGRLSPAAP